MDVPTGTSSPSTRPSTWSAHDANPRSVSSQGRSGATAAHPAASSRARVESHIRESSGNAWSRRTVGRTRETVTDDDIDHGGRNEDPGPRGRQPRPEHRGKRRVDPAALHDLLGPEVLHRVREAVN